MRPLANRLDHIVLTVADIAATCEFYGRVLGMKVVTFANFFELFKDILNEKQLDGLRLLLTPFPQQQFNLTDDRRSDWLRCSSIVPTFSSSISQCRA